MARDRQTGELRLVRFFNVGARIGDTRWIHEWRAWHARLDPEVVPPLCEVGWSGAMFFVAQRACEGVSLSTLLASERDGQTLSAPTLLALISAVARFVAMIERDRELGTLVSFGPHDVVVRAGDEQPDFSIPALGASVIARCASDRTVREGALARDVVALARASLMNPRVVGAPRGGVPRALWSLLRSFESAPPPSVEAFVSGWERVMRSVDAGEDVTVPVRSGAARGPTALLPRSTPPAHPPLRDPPTPTLDVSCSTEWTIGESRALTRTMNRAPRLDTRGHRAQTINAPIDRTERVLGYAPPPRPTSQVTVRRLTAWAWLWGAMRVWFGALRYRPRA